MAEWTDDRLKNSPPGFYEEGEVGYPVWTPNLEIRNAKSPAEVTSSSCRVGEGGVVTLMKRVMVEVVADFNCFRYPFDKHKVRRGAPDGGACRPRPRVTGEGAEGGSQMSSPTRLKQCICRPAQPR